MLFAGKLQRGFRPLVQRISFPFANARSIGAGFFLFGGLVSLVFGRRCVLEFRVLWMADDLRLGAHRDPSSFVVQSSGMAMDRRLALGQCSGRNAVLFSSGDA